jgi:serine/threonine-protein kinase RsbW
MCQGHACVSRHPANVEEHARPRPVRFRPYGAQSSRFPHESSMKPVEIMRVDLSLSLPREEISVPLARHVVSAALSTAGVDPACVREVEVALSEACTTAVRHAVDGVTYEVAIAISDEQVAMDVIDSGSAFGQRQAPTDGHRRWSETGYGLKLIHALSDLAIFDSVEGEGGTVHLTMKLRWFQGAQGPEPTQNVERPR